MELIMNRLIYIKEVFLKNDLTYLTLGYFLFLTSLELEMPSAWMTQSLLICVPFVISGVYLSLGWYFSLVKRNIFNSVYKFMVIPAIAIFLMKHLALMSNLQFEGGTYQINVIFMVIFTLVVAYVCHSLIMSKAVNLYTEYVAKGRVLETEFLENTYRSLTYGGRISYHYDERVNLYIIGDCMCSGGNKLFVKENDKQIMGTLPEYCKYFKDLNIDYYSMNADNLEVFKMYSI